MSDAISEMVMTGKIDFKSLCNEMISDIIKVQMRAAMASVVSSMTGSVSGIFSGLGMGGSAAGDSNAALSSYAAQGRVFSDGAVTPYAYGGVVRSPTYFPMARGMGLMGEAGAEAVMPLTRINGKLGVQTTGSGESSNLIPPNVVINNNTGQTMKQQGNPQFDGKAWVVQIVADNIDNGGILSHKMRG